MSETYNVYPNLDSYDTLPLVSVIIPAYNAEKFIAATLESVLSQSYKKIEVVIVDDGSGDRTVEIVQEFAAKDNRVILFQQSNSGVAAARNLAIQKSKGEYIAPIDADDIWYPEKIEKQVQCMFQASPSVGLVYTWTAHINEEGLPTGTYHRCNLEGNVLTAIFCEEPIGNASVPLIRRSYLEKVGLYDTNLKEQDAQGLEDFDIYLRIAEHYEFRVIPEVLVGYRQVFGSMSRNTLTMAKSYNLVVENIRLRHPEISTDIYNRHRSEMYYWFAFMSKQSGDHWRTLSWLIKALLLAPKNLLRRPMLYKTFLLAILYILAQPITSLFWTPQSWYQFRKKLIRNRNSSSSSDNKSCIPLEMKF
ncbi:family 2 glycosyl transferase [Scytonema sp. HK-05]|uniref:glycosyltransferase family 2 protein n=1 Tax=Scytonema sp. HK-05 TaxID=1137095 RepID=UPI000936CD4A|nr:glycosyltransferase family A protein [Scytonema sp. HK-05]OKH58473.1 hypothetical protein NIES2130_14420 [Scytonema sp. HK-05]BAY49263.1 family 2 glycosyl transferase [Scytonema sp. HK-05]